MQTAQSQPIIGTPCDVPLPRNVTRAGAVAPRLRGVVTPSLSGGQGMMMRDCDCSADAPWLASTYRMRSS